MDPDSSSNISFMELLDKDILEDLGPVDLSWFETLRVKTFEGKERKNDAKDSNIEETDSRCTTLHPPRKEVLHSTGQAQAASPRLFSPDDNRGCISSQKFIFNCSRGESPAVVKLETPVQMSINEDHLLGTKTSRLPACGTGEKLETPMTTQKRLAHSLGVDSCDISWSSSMATPPASSATSGQYEVTPGTSHNHGAVRVLFSPDSTMQSQDTLGFEAIPNTTAEENTEDEETFAFKSLNKAPDAAGETVAHSPHVPSESGTQTAVSNNHRTEHVETPERRNPISGTTNAQEVPDKDGENSVENSVKDVKCCIGNIVDDLDHVDTKTDLSIEKDTETSEILQNRVGSNAPRSDGFCDQECDDTLVKVNDSINKSVIKPTAEAYPSPVKVKAQSGSAPVTPYEQVKAKTRLLPGLENNLKVTPLSLEKRFKFQTSTPLLPVHEESEGLSGARMKGRSHESISMLDDALSIFDTPPARSSLQKRVAPKRAKKNLCSESEESHCEMNGAVSSRTPKIGLGQEALSLNDETDKIPVKSVLPEAVVSFSQDCANDPTGEGKVSESASVHVDENIAKNFEEHPPVANSEEKDVLSKENTFSGSEGFTPQQDDAVESENIGGIEFTQMSQKTMTIMCDAAGEGNRETSQHDSACPRSPQEEPTGNNDGFTQISPSVLCDMVSSAEESHCNNIRTNPRVNPHETPIGGKPLDRLSETNSKKETDLVQSYHTLDNNLLDQVGDIVYNRDRAVSAEQDRSSPNSSLPRKKAVGLKLRKAKRFSYPTSSQILNTCAKRVFNFGESDDISQKGESKHDSSVGSTVDGALGNCSSDETVRKQSSNSSDSVSQTKVDPSKERISVSETNMALLGDGDGLPGCNKVDTIVEGSMQRSVPKRVPRPIWKKQSTAITTLASYNQKMLCIPEAKTVPTRRQDDSLVTRPATHDNSSKSPGGQCLHSTDSVMQDSSLSTTTYKATSVKDKESEMEQCKTERTEEIGSNIEMGFSTHHENPYISKPETDENKEEPSQPCSKKDNETDENCVLKSRPDITNVENGQKVCNSEQDTANDIPGFERNLSVLNMPSLPKPCAFQGFSKASGGTINVSKTAMAKAVKLLEDDKYNTLVNAESESSANGFNRGIPKKILAEGECLTDDVGNLAHDESGVKQSKFCDKEKQTPETYSKGRNRLHFSNDNSQNNTMIHTSKGHMVTHGFSGFQTASGSKVEVSAKASEKAAVLMASIERDILCLEKGSKELKPPDIHTSKEQSNSELKQFDNADRTVFEEISEEAKSETISVNAGTVHKSDSSEPHFQESDRSCALQRKAKHNEPNQAFAGFQSAAGKMLLVSNAAQEKAKALMSEIDSELTMQFDRNPSFSSDKKESEEYRSRPTTVGFTTASGKHLKISASAEERANKLMMEVDKDLKLESVGSSNPEMGAEWDQNLSLSVDERKSEGQRNIKALEGFSTASGKHLKVSTAAQEKAYKLMLEVDKELQVKNERNFNEDTPKDTGIMTFHTNSHKKQSGVDPRPKGYRPFKPPRPTFNTDKKDSLAEENVSKKLRSPNGNFSKGSSGPAILHRQELQEEMHDGAKAGNIVPEKVTELPVLPKRSESHRESSESFHTSFDEITGTQLTEIIETTEAFLQCVDAIDLEQTQKNTSSVNIEIEPQQIQTKDTNEPDSHENLENKNTSRQGCVTDDCKNPQESVLSELDCTKENKVEGKEESGALVCAGEPELKENNNGDNAEVYSAKTDNTHGPSTTSVGTATDAPEELQQLAVSVNEGTSTSTNINCSLERQNIPNSNQSVCIKADSSVAEEKGPSEVCPDSIAHSFDIGEKDQLSDWDDPVEEDEFSEEEPVVGFCTASGKDLSFSQHSLMKAQNLFDSVWGPSLEDLSDTEYSDGEVPCATGDKKEEVSIMPVLWAENSCRKPTEMTDCVASEPEGNMPVLTPVLKAEIFDKTKMPVESCNNVNELILQSAKQESVKPGLSDDIKEEPTVCEQSSKATTNNNMTRYVGSQEKMQAGKECPAEISSVPVKSTQVNVEMLHRHSGNIVTCSWPDQKFKDKIGIEMADDVSDISLLALPDQENVDPRHDTSDHNEVQQQITASSDIKDLSPKNCEELDDCAIGVKSGCCVSDYVIQESHSQLVSNTSGLISGMNKGADDGYGTFQKLTCEKQMTQIITSGKQAQITNTDNISKGHDELTFSRTSEIGNQGHSHTVISSMSSSLGTNTLSFQEQDITCNVINKNMAPSEADQKEAQTKGIISESLNSLHIKPNMKCANSIEINDGFAGFSTASGNSMQISKAALQKAKDMLICEISDAELVKVDSKVEKANDLLLLLENKEMEKDAINSQTEDGSDILAKHETAWPTNSPEKIPTRMIYNEETHSHTDELSMNEILIGSSTPPRECDDLESENHSGEIVKAQAFQGFSTASGSKISITKEALTKAKRLLQEDSTGLKESQNSASADKNAALDTKKITNGKTEDSKADHDRLPEDLEERARHVGIESHGQSGSDGVDYSNDSKLQENVKQSNIPGNVEALGMVASDAPEMLLSFGFATASGKKVQVSKEALDTARNLLNEESHTVPDVLQLAQPMDEGLNKPLETAYSHDDVRKILPDEADLDKMKAFPKTTVDTMCPPSPHEKTVISSAQGEQYNSLSNASVSFEKRCVFSTGSGKPVNVSAKSLEKARVFLSDNSDLSVHGHGRNSVEAPAGPKNERSTSVEISFNFGFSTASGHKVHISETAIKQAKAVLQEDDYADQGKISKENNNLQLPPVRGANEEHSFRKTDMKYGFATAAGKAVKVSQAALGKARALLHEEKSPVKLNNSSELPVGSMLQIGNKGFSTASGHAVKVSAKALEQAKTLLHESLEEGNHKPETRNIQNTDNPNTLVSRLSPANFGFSTASGNSVQVSADSLKKARQLINDDNEGDTVQSTKNKTCGFSTASGNSVHVSTDSLEKAKRLFQDDAASESFQLKSNKNNSFSAASGNPVQVTADSLEKAKELFDGDDTILNTKTASGGFSTASGHAVEVSKVSLEKARNLFNDDLKENNHGKLLKNRETKKISQSLPSLPNEILEREDTDGDRSSGLKNMSSEHTTVIVESQTSRKADEKKRTDELLTCESTARPSVVEEKEETHAEQRRKIGTDQNDRQMTGIHAEPEGVVCDRETATFKKMSSPVVTSPIDGGFDIWEDENAPQLAVPNREVNHLTPAKEKPNQSSEVNQASDPDIMIERKSQEKQEVPEEMLKKRLKARVAQAQRIRSKKDATIRPQPGQMYRQKKNKGQRSSVRGAVKGGAPGRYTVKQLLEMGVQPSTLTVTSKTAREYRFQLWQFYSTKHLNGSDVLRLSDGAVLVPDDDNCASKEQFYSSLMDLEGVDPRLVDRDWVYNHYRWIVWKLAAYETSFPHQFAGCSLTPDQVLLQLKYRYDNEVDNCHRSALKKIYEHDDTAAKPVVLCVASIVKPETKQRHQEDTNIPTSLELTDGWYRIRGLLDKPLSQLVENQRIAVGTKLLLYGAELTGTQEAAPPLQAPADVGLKLCANSVRRVRWDTRLGYQHTGQPLLVPLSSLYADGGLVSCVDVIVIRTYPLQYFEKLPDGSSVWRSTRSEQKAALKYEIDKQRQLENLYASLQTEYERKVLDKGNGRTTRRRSMRTTSVDLSSYTMGQEIHEVLQGAMDPDSLEAELSMEQRDRLTDYRRRLQEQAQADLQREFTRRMAEQQQNLSARNVIPVLKIRLAGCNNRDLDRKAGATLTVWRPSDDVIETLVEGKRFYMHNLTASENRSKQPGMLEVSLSSTRSTRYQPRQIDDNFLDLVYEPREVTWFSELTTSFRPPHQEVDIVGIVISVSPISTFNKQGQGAAAGRVQTVYLADADYNLCSIKFWGGLQGHCVEDILKPRAVVTCSSLQWHQELYHGIPTLTAHDLSQFTANPKQQHFQHSLNKLAKLFQEETTFMETMNEKLTEVLGHVSTPGNNKTQRHLVQRNQVQTDPGPKRTVKRCYTRPRQLDLGTCPGPVTVGGPAPSSIQSPVPFTSRKTPAARHFGLVQPRKRRKTDIGIHNQDLQSSTRPHAPDTKDNAVSSVSKEPVDKLEHTTKVEKAASVLTSRSETKEQAELLNSTNVKSSLNKTQGSASGGDIVTKTANVTKPSQTDSTCSSRETQQMELQTKTNQEASGLMINQVHSTPKPVQKAFSIHSTPEGSSSAPQMDLANPESSKKKDLQKLKAMRLEWYGKPPPLLDFQSPLPARVRKDFKPPVRSSEKLDRAKLDQTKLDQQKEEVTQLDEQVTKAKEVPRKRRVTDLDISDDDNVSDDKAHMRNAPKKKLCHKRAKVVKSSAPHDICDNSEQRSSVTDQSSIEGKLSGEGILNLEKSNPSTENDSGEGQLLKNSKTAVISDLQCEILFIQENQQCTETSDTKQVETSTLNSSSVQNTEREALKTVQTVTESEKHNRNSLMNQAGPDEKDISSCTSKTDEEPRPDKADTGVDKVSTGRLCDAGQSSVEVESQNSDPGGDQKGKKTKSRGRLKRNKVNSRNIYEESLPGTTNVADFVSDPFGTESRRRSLRLQKK